MIWREHDQFPAEQMPVLEEAVVQQDNPLLSPVCIDWSHSVLLPSAHVPIGLGENSPKSSSSIETTAACVRCNLNFQLSSVSDMHTCKLPLCKYLADL